MSEPAFKYEETTVDVNASLHAALAASHAAFKPIKKRRTAKMGSYSYAYADLGDIIAAVTPVLAKNGLAVSQTFSVIGDGAVLLLRTSLLHAAGGAIHGYMPVPWGDSTPQHLGSLITYMRRYALCALLSIAAEDDDDGQSAAAPPATRGEPLPGTQPRKKGGDKPRTISEPQRKRMFALANEGAGRIGCDRKVVEEALRLRMADLGFESSNDITVPDAYENLCGWLEGVMTRVVDEAEGPF
jgi:hypothetical protein